jgi:fatty-acyl-CoA synthase
VNFLLKGNELAYVLKQSDADALITMDKFRGYDYLAALDAIAPGWQTGRVETLPRLRHVFVRPTEGTGRSDFRDLSALEALANAQSDAELQRREAAGTADSLSDIIYTSGTTGDPKGVMLTHDMVQRAAYASVYTSAFEDGRRIAFALPMYHVFGYVECMIGCLYVGGAVIPRPIFDAADMLDAAERLQASEIGCVPMMTNKMLELVRTRGFDASHLIAMFNSGGINVPTVWQDIRALLHAPEILTGYGMTETTASTTLHRPENDDARLLTSNGQLKLAGVAGDPAIGGYTALYKAIDPVTGADLPPGTSGELVVRGPIVTRGYYNKPKETAAAFTPDGWLRTGDIGIVDAEGYLSLTGRSKESYRCGGETVMPREVEALYDNHPLIEQALIVGIPDAKMGEVGCLCVVPKTGAERPDPEALIAIAAKSLARFKVPRYVIFLEAKEISLTPTGRPQKFHLKTVAAKKVEAQKTKTKESAR